MIKILVWFRFTSDILALVLKHLIELLVSTEVNKVIIKSGWRFTSEI